MHIFDLYKIGRAIPYGFSLESDQKKFDDIYFEYTSKEVNTTVMFFFAIVFMLYYMASFIEANFALTVFFLGAICCIIIYVYPTRIHYNYMIMEYNEQMFKAVLGMSNFISMKTSLEYAFFETSEQLRGILRIEFDDIKRRIQRKDKNSLGDAFKLYIQKWNAVDKVFVKSLRLLETAVMADEKDMDEIIKETIRTLLINYRIRGKRSAEELASKARGLISFGVMLPVISLMLLPLLSIFMADMIKTGMVMFMYNVMFPTILLLVALDFATKRIQIDTIHLEESPSYRQMPRWIYYICFVVIIGFAFPALIHLMNIDLSTFASAENEYKFLSIFYIWLLPFGIMLGIFIFVKYYIHLHEKQWLDVRAAEDDLPHLLQIFTTYLSLNISIENIIPSIASDYRSEGFSDHPIVRMFTELSRKLIYTKGNLFNLLSKILDTICPSFKVKNVLSNILSFSTISQDSAKKAAKLIREQTIALLELDDYIRTLLAETVGLLNISITMLMPLLSAVAVIMSVVIVKAINFITDQLKEISSAFGGGGIELNLVDITKIIPPTMLEIIVSLYFIEMYIIISLFATKIEIGNDNFMFAKKLDSNIMGFIIYSVILLGGHVLMIEMFFKGLLE